MNNAVMINGVIYHVVAGHTLLGQVVKKSTCSWEAQSCKDDVETTFHKRRHIAVDHLIKEREVR